MSYFSHLIISFLFSNVKYVTISFLWKMLQIHYEIAVGVEEKELVAEYTITYIVVALPEFFIHFLNLLLFPLAATFNNGERIQSRVNGACIEPIHLFSRGSARFKISGEASAVLRNRDLKSKFPIFKSFKIDETQTLSGFRKICNQPQ